MVPPEDVAELAQSKGIPIYMISTREAKLEPVSSTVFERMSAATGGEAYFAKTWRDQQKAFASIRNDLAHLYSAELLSAAQSEPRLAHHHREAGRRPLEEVPHPHPKWISTTVGQDRRRNGWAARRVRANAGFVKLKRGRLESPRELKLSGAAVGVCIHGCSCRVRLGDRRKQFFLKIRAHPKTVARSSENAYHPPFAGG